VKIDLAATVRSAAEGDMQKTDDGFQSRNNSADAAKLAALIRELESATAITPNRKARNRHHELAAIREGLNKIVKKHAQQFCNCKQIAIADSAHWREFETEIKTPCAVHGQRRFQIIVTVMGYPEDRDPDDQRLAELLLRFSDGG
jgi:arylsulfatase A-like enzyme